MMMGVMVRLADGDRERFETATAYVRDADGYLFVTDANGEQVALLAPGWTAALEYPVKKVADVIEGSGMGRTFRKRIDG
jgi:hypothetical protein